MAPGKHSKYSPSGMADKMLCLGRHLATEGMSGGSSAAAERGTECHEWAEELIFNQEATVPECFVEDWQEGCTRDMVQHALDIYDELTLKGDVVLKVEQQVNLGWLNNKQFDLAQVYGTCDVVMYSPDSGELIVLDYKTGYGEVDPVENTQLKIYAVGALGSLPEDMIPLIKRIRVVVSQPRTDKDAKVWYTTPTDLVRWATDTLAEACYAMSRPGAPFTAGEKQCKYCPINGGACPVQNGRMMDLLDSCPKPSDVSVDAQTVNNLLCRLPEFKQWANQIEGRAQGMLEDGQDLPDFKLVRGRSSRRWADEEAAEKFLRGQKLKEKERYTYKLLTVPQAEKVLKDKLKKTTITRNKFEALITKPEGKITWALKTDKREAVNTANPMDQLITIDDL